MSRRVHGWQVEHGEMVVGGETVGDIARRYGTPLYLYDTSIIRQRAQTLRSSFPDFAVLYSVKSNPNRKVCELLAGLGFGAGVSSVAEIELALACGFAPDKLAYVGPAKSYHDLAVAADAHVGMIYAESRTELERLETIARERGAPLPIALRVNTRNRPSSAGEFMAGEPSPFGIDEETIPEVVQAVDSRWLKVVGIHTFVASQVLDADSLVLHFDRVARLAVKMSQDLGLELTTVNFGGGFGVAYSPSERVLDIERLGRRVGTELMGRLDHLNTRPQLYLEVGRYLVAEAGVFLAEIVDVKQSRGTTFVVTDSGISGFARPAMPWAQAHPCSIVSKMGARRRTDTCKVVGPSCMPGDVLCESAELPAPTPGDIVAIHNAGAYGLSMSMLAWGSFRPPIEVIVDDGQFELCKVKAVCHRDTAEVL